MKTLDDFFEEMTPLQKLNKSYGKEAQKAKKDAHTKAAFEKTKKELAQAMGKGGMDKHISSVSIMPRQHSFKLVGTDVNKIVQVLDLMIGLKELARRNYQIKKYPSSNAVVLLHWSAIDAKLDRKWKNIWTANPWHGR